MYYILNKFVKIIKLSNNNFLLYIPLSQEIAIITNKEYLLIKKGVYNSKNENISKLIDNEFLIDINTDYANYFNKKKGLILKKKDYGIHILYLILHSKCNLNCKYCFVKHNFDNNSLTENDIVKILQIFKNQKSKLKKRIILYGGEPLLSLQLFKFTIDKINAIFKNNCDISVITNGLNINKQYINIIKKNNISLGLSLDGFNKRDNFNRVDNNNINRYDDIKKSFDLLVENNVPINISCTISKENINNVKDFVNELDKNISGFSYNLLIKNKIVYPKEFSKKLFEIMTILLNKQIPEDRIYYRRFIALLNKSYYIKECAGMGNQLVALPNKKIGICHGYDWDNQFYFNKNIDDIPINHDFTKEYVWKVWNKRSTLNIPNCWNCIGLTTCGGGCVVNTSKGKDIDIYNVDQNHCKIYKEIITIILKKIGYGIINEKKL